MAKITATVGCDGGFICNYANGRHLLGDDMKLMSAKYCKTTVNKFFAPQNTFRAGLCEISRQEEVPIPRSK